MQGFNFPMEMSNQFKCSLIGFLLIFVAVGLNGQTINDDSIRQLIDKMVKEDQYWRSMLRKYNNREGGINFSYGEIERNIHKTDSISYLSLRYIIKSVGYPNYDKVGEISSRNFWLLSQHQDANVEFQDSVLTLMKIEVDKGKAPADNYAYLLDRVRINSGKKQVYGTQMELDSINHTFKPKPIEENSNLNNLRKAMGLPSIEEYTKIMNEHYHGQLHK